MDFEIQEHYDQNKVHEIPLSLVFADSDFNCRGIIDPLSVAELAKDIAKNGLTQPILVQPWNKQPGKHFRIVAGYRRYMAHQIAQLPTVRALVRENLDDLDARVMNISENVQRQDLTIVQEAKAIDHLRLAGWGEYQVAERIGKSRGWVQVRFMLLSLPEDVQELADKGVLSQAEIRVAAGLYDKEGSDIMYGYVRKIVDAKLGGKVLEKEVKPHKPKQNLRKERRREEIFQLQDTIREALGGNSLTTKALGWAAGEVSDLEMHNAIRDAAVDAGKFYMVPEEIVGKHAITIEPEPEPEPVEQNQ